MARHDLRSGDGPLKIRLFPGDRAIRLLIGCLALAIPAVAQAGQITIAWDRDPEPTTVGYKIHSAPVGQPFGSPVDVGDVSSFTLAGLDPALAYHAAVSAYDIFRQESPLSAEVVYNPGPEEPAVADADQDGLPDSLELAGCTNPNDADTDDDGLADGTEDGNRNGIRDAGETSPCAVDSDGDSLQDGTELGLTAALVGPSTDLAIFRPDLDPASASDPLSVDTDGDGLTDGREDLNANGRVDAGETNPLVPDNPLLFADTFSDGSAAGDPSWRQLRGAWSVIGAAKRYASTSGPLSLALIGDPKVRGFSSGRIDSWVSLTRRYTTAPNARIVFHYQDASHYRYVRLTNAGVSIGQVGSNPVEQGGVKASLRRRLAVNTGYRLRIDIEDGTRVRVYINDGVTPVLTYRFTVNSSGRVGYRTEGARSLFDNISVSSDLALQ